jgi:hypothetical protein
VTRRPVDGAGGGWGGKLVVGKREGEFVRNGGCLMHGSLWGTVTALCPGGWSVFVVVGRENVLRDGGGKGEFVKRRVYLCICINLPEC